MIVVDVVSVPPFVPAPLAGRTSFHVSPPVIATVLRDPKSVAIETCPAISFVGQPTPGSSVASVGAPRARHRPKG